MMVNRRTRSALAVGAAALCLGGCGAAPQSACVAPDIAPVRLADTNASDPVAAASANGAAVAAWGSTTGQPVQVRLRRPDGGWGPPTSLGDYRTARPAVVVDSGGVPWVAFEGYDADDHAAVFAASAPDWRPTLVSQGHTNARDPQIGAAGNGTLVAAWITFVDGTRGAIAVSVHDARGWSRPAILTPVAARLSDLDLSVAPDGSAVLAWTDAPRRPSTWAMVRTPDGRWSTPRNLSASDRAAVQPAAAATAGGTGWVAWLETRSDGSAAKIATRAFHDHDWGGPVTLDAADQGPRQMPRPGQAPLGPRLVAANGRLAAAWAIGTGAGSQIRARQYRPGTGWDATIRLSDPENLAGAAAIALGPDGRAVVAWEEIDHGLLRARSRRLGAGVRCTDLTGAVTESGSVALAGGGHPLAVFIDLRRNAVEAQSVR